MSRVSCKKFPASDISTTSPTDAHGAWEAILLSLSGADATLSLNVCFDKSKGAEYLTYEGLRQIASCTGGYLSVKRLRDICAGSGANQRTIFRHIKSLTEQGLLLKHPTQPAWQVVSEIHLHRELGGSKKSYMGYDSITMPVADLLSFFGKSPVPFREYLLVHGPMLVTAKLQNRVRSGLAKMLDRALNGEKVIKRRGVDPDGVPFKEYYTLEEIKERISFYEQNELIYDLSGFAANLTGKKTKRIQTEETQTEAPLLSDRLNAQCSIKNRVLSDVTKDGEELKSARQNNLTTFSHSRYLDAGDLVISDPAKQHKSASGGGCFETMVWEANISIKKLAEISGWSTTTVSRRLSKQRKDLVIQPQVVVVGEVGETLSSGLVQYDQKADPLRFRWYPVRMACRDLWSMEANGWSVQWNNINGGDPDRVKDCGQVYAMVFMRSYYIVLPKLPKISKNSSRKMQHR